MKARRVASVSLGSSRRDARAEIALGDVRVDIERRGMDGDLRAARDQFCALDGEVDALGLGGFELSVRVGGREYPLVAGQRLVRDVRRTPVVDGRGLKEVLERRVFDLTDGATRTRRYRRAFLPSGIDRYGLSHAVTQVAARAVFGDLMFVLGVPVPITRLATLARIARLLLPAVRRLPPSMLYPLGDKQEAIKPKFERYFREADLLAGDFHYLRRHLPHDLSGKTIVTNTTTGADVELLRARGLDLLITTTPGFQGRCFGTNVVEAAMTAALGANRPLTDEEIAAAIERFTIRPQVTELQAC